MTLSHLEDLRLDQCRDRFGWMIGAAIVAITPNIATSRKLSVVWGVHCVVAEDARDQDDMVNRAGRIAFRDGFVRAGQRVIIVAGVPLRIPGTTNMLRIASVGPDRDAET